MAPDLSFQHVANVDMECSEQNGNAGSSERGVYDQLLFEHSNVFMGPTSCHQQSTDDEFGVNGDALLSADGHAVETNPDAGLVAKNTGFFEGVVDEGRADEATVVEHGAAIHESAIDVANLDISADLSAPGGEGAVADFYVFNAQSLSLVSLQLLPGFVSERNELIGPPLFDAAASLKSGEDQEDPDVLSHGTSFGTKTVLPNLYLSNDSVEKGLSGWFGVFG